jgi:hypothetical protein
MSFAKPICSVVPLTFKTLCCGSYAMRRYGTTRSGLKRVNLQPFTP